MLLTAIIGGYAAKWVRIPRVVTLILGGIGLKYWMGLVSTAEQAKALAEPLSIINTLALGIILFMIGRVFDVGRTKATRGMLRRISPFDIGLTVLLVTIGCAAAAWTLPGMVPSLSLAIGLLLACAAIEAAPATTWYVLQEYDAKGPTTDYLLVSMGFNCLVSIIAFHVVFIVLAQFGVLAGVKSVNSWRLDILSLSLGSIGLGALLGVVMAALHSRLPLREMVLVFFACMLLMVSCEYLARHFFAVTLSPMVICLAMGMAFERTAQNASFFEKTVETASIPIFALFFVLAGYNLHLEELGHIGVLGSVYVLMRVLGKYFGIRYAVRQMGSATKAKENAGLGLICQAGVAIFLGAYLVDQWAHPMAAKINAVILAAVAICELGGAMLVKHVVIGAGEVKAVTLLRPGFWQKTWITLAPGVQNLAQKYPDRASLKGKAAESLTVKHIMRRNMHSLLTTATFDEVLNFIESSRFHDFPVADSKGTYVGMVHFHRVRNQLYDPDSVDLVTAGFLADKGTPAVTPETDLPTVLGFIHDYGLGEIAVVDNHVSKRLIGLIEQRDLLRVLV